MNLREQRGLELAETRTIRKRDGWWWVKNRELTSVLRNLLVTAEGGLRVLLNPLPDFATGEIRAFGTQKAIEALGCQR